METEWKNKKNIYISMLNISESKKILGVVTVNHLNQRTVVK